jgi:hypothetical protein
MNHILKWNKCDNSVIFLVKVFLFMIPVLDISNCCQYFFQILDFSSVEMTEKNFVLTLTQVAHSDFQVKSLEHIYEKNHLPVNHLHLQLLLINLMFPN